MIVKYKLIINGLSHNVCFASNEEIKKRMCDDEDYNGYYDSKPLNIVIANDLDLEQAKRSFTHEYIHAHRYVGGYTRQSINEEDICDYIMHNLETIYFQTEHFEKHYKEVIDK